MRSPLDWLRNQSWVARAIFSAAFAAITAVGYFWADRVWHWGIFMAVAPWLFRQRSSEEEDFFRPVKATNEKPLSATCVEVNDGSVESLLTGLAAKTTSGLDPDKIGAVVESLRDFPVGGEKRFQYLVMFAGQPTSLQIVIRRKQAEAVEIEAISDARLVAILAGSNVSARR
jgi:hypothetical protein